MQADTLVLGIGNVLLGDEGVGVHVVNRLQANHPRLERVSFMDGGTLSFSLAAPLADTAWLVVVDAAEFRAPPGTVRVLEGAAMDAYLANGGRRSVHEVGLIDLLGIARFTGGLPERRALVGIQPGSIGWSDRPGPEVAAAVPAACDHVLELIGRWRQ